MTCKEFDNFYRHNVIFQDSEDNFYLESNGALFPVSKELKRLDRLATGKISFEGFENPVVYNNGVIVADGYLIFDRKGNEAKELMKLNRQIEKMSERDELDEYVVSENGNYLVCFFYGSGQSEAIRDSRFLKIYNKDSGYKSSSSFTWKSSYITELSISQSELYLAFVTSDKVLRVLDIESMDIVIEKKLHTGQIAGFNWSTSDELFLSFYDKTEVLSVKEGIKVKEIKHKQNGNFAVINRSGSTLVVYSWQSNWSNDNQDVIIYDLDRMEERTDFIFPKSYKVQKARFSSNGLLYTFSYKKICIWDLEDEGENEIVIDVENKIPTVDVLFEFLKDMGNKDKKEFEALTNDLLCSNYSGSNTAVLSKYYEKYPNNYILMRLKNKERIFSNDKNTETYQGYSRGLGRIKNSRIRAREKYNLVNGILQPFLKYDQPISNAESEMKFLIVHYLNGLHLWELHEWMSSADGNSKRSSPLYSMDKYNEFVKILELYKSDIEKLKSCNCTEKNINRSNAIVEKAISSIGGIKFSQMSKATMALKRQIKVDGLSNLYINKLSDTEVYSKLDNLFTTEAFTNYVELLAFYNEPSAIESNENLSETIFLEDDHSFLEPIIAPNEGVKDMSFYLYYLNLKLVNSVESCERVSVSDLKKRQFTDWFNVKEVEYKDHIYSCDIKFSRLNVFKTYIENKLRLKEVEENVSDSTKEKVEVKFRENISVRVVRNLLDSNQSIHSDRYEILDESNLKSIDYREATMGVNISVNDSGAIWTDVCEDSYIVIFTNEFGEETTSKDPYKDSYAETGGNEFSFPVKCEVKYKSSCSDEKYKSLAVVFKKKGFYTINF